MNNLFQKHQVQGIGFLLLSLIFILTGCDKSERIYLENDPNTIEQQEPIYPEPTGTGTTYTETQDISEDVLEHTILSDIHDDPNKVDYRITVSSWEIRGELYIESGVVLEFISDATVNVWETGKISRYETNSKDVRFTGKEKTAGSWIGLIGHPGSRILLGNCTIEYAGGSLSGSDTPSAIQTEGNLSLWDSKIKHSAGYGVRIFTSGGGHYLGNNTFTDNKNAAISTIVDNLHSILTQNEFARNGHNGVQISTSTLEDGPCPAPVLPLTANGSGSYLIENEDPSIPADLIIETNLEILPGVTFKFGAGAGMSVKANIGMITARGTSSTPITFEGKRAEQGYWKGIFLEQSSETSWFEYVSVKHGGSAVFHTQLPFKGNIGVLDGFLNISNSTIADSDGCAFATHQTQNGNTLIEESNNTFSNNEGGQFCGL